MKKMDIKTLITKFYAGETNEQEEMELIDFFSKDDIPEGMKQEKAFFTQFFGLQEAAPKGLEQHLDRQINGWNMIEKSSVRKVRKLSLRWSLGIAASLLAILSLGIFTMQQDNQSSYAEQEDTYSNPEDAYKETAKVLTLFSEKLNKGLNAINKNDKK
jgi:hypothetical protein